MSDPLPKLMTEAEFRNHDNLRGELEGLLNNPVLALVLRIAEDAVKPRGSVLLDGRPGDHIDTLSSQKYWRLVGGQSTIDRIYRMTKANPTTEEAALKEFDENPFAYTLSQTMREALIKKRAQEQQKQQS